MDPLVIKGYIYGLLTAGLIGVAVWIGPSMVAKIKTLPAAVTRQLRAKEIRHKYYSAERRGSQGEAKT